MTQVLAATIAVYIGTSPGKGQTPGIYLSQFNPATGELSKPALVAKAKRPSFLAAHPTAPFLYACDETDGTAGHKSGGVIGFRVDPASFALTEINGAMSAGLGPCFVEVAPSGRTLLTANYGNGAVASLPIDPATGKLSEAVGKDQHQGKGPNAKRQDGPHAHCFRVDPTGKFALSADLGTDDVFVYALGDDSSLTPTNPPTIKLAPGSGPRHLAFSKDGKFLYVGTEMGNTVTAFAWDGATGRAKEIQTISTLPADFKGTSYVAEVTASPNGKFLYVSNRGHDSIACFAIDASTGQLALKSHASTLGKFPRHFALDPSGNWMIVGNQNSGDLFVFKVDQETGALTPTGAKTEVPAPTCIRFWR